MNLILLQPSDFIASQRVRLQGRRLQHVLEVHQAELGQRLQVGLINGPTGLGTVLSLNHDSLELEVELNTPALPPLPLTLILALPRPKMLKRILQHCTSLGVQRLVLLNAYKVEKSYWQTPILEAASVQEQLILGLEQARTTFLPEVMLRKRFKPFVEDELATLAADSQKLVAHPYTEHACPANLQQACTLAVGPEGGFINYEVEKLQEQGFQAVHLGPRILRVETAVPVLISKLYY